MLEASRRKSYLIRKELKRFWIAYLPLGILLIVNATLENEKGGEITPIIT